MNNLVHKFDRKVLPIVTCLYLCAFLCRVNIANVHTEILVDLGLTKDDYTWLIVAFFIGYTIFEVPSNLCLKRFGAPNWLAFLCFVWGSFSCMTAFLSSFEWLFVGRLLVGTFEAGIFPGILYYLSLWYVKSERGFRFSIFFLSSLVASSLSGLFSYGLLQMDGVGGMAGWRWVFLLEGLPSVLFAPVVFVWLAASPSTASWLSAEERMLASARLDTNTAAVSQMPSSSGEQVSVQGSDSEDDSSGQGSCSSSCVLVVSSSQESSSDSTVAAVNPYKSPVIWSFSLLYLLASIPMASVSFFLPKIVELAGFSSVMGNLITAPLYLFAAIYVLFYSRHSDRHQERGYHIACGMFISSCGFFGLALIPAKQSISLIVTSLLCAQLTVIGSASVIPLTCVWLSGTIHASNPKLLAVASGLMVTFGQISGVLTPMIYSRFSRKSEETGVLDYRIPHGIVSCIAFIGIFMSLLNLQLVKRSSYFISSGTGDETTQHQTSGKDHVTADNTIKAHLIEE